jgi:nucleoside-diphosphate-sugar epimerase
LLAAAREAGVRRLVAQSFAPYRYIREGSMIKAEDDALDPNPPKSASETFAAMTHVDQAFLSIGGIVLRYGGFYGAPDSMSKAVAKRQYPIVGDGTGLMPFVHLDDATSATVLALEHEGPAVYNVTDDDSAPMSEWRPALASALGAKRPFRIPVALGNVVMGKEMVKLSLSPGARRTPGPRRDSAGRSATRAGVRASLPLSGSRPSRSGSSPDPAASYVELRPMRLMAAASYGLSVAGSGHRQASVSRRVLAAGPA